MKPATLLTSVLLVAIAVLHVMRLVAGVQMTVGGVPIPMWPSGIAALVPLALVAGLWWEHRPTGGRTG